MPLAASRTDDERYQDALVELKKVDYIAEGTYSALPLASLMRALLYVKLGENDNAMVGFKKLVESKKMSSVAATVDADQLVDWLRELP